MITISCYRAELHKANKREDTVMFVAKYIYGKRKILYKIGEVITIVLRSNEREFPFTDEMLECETGSLLGRVADLERQSLAQRDEIVCLRATLADALRRIALLEGREKREDERNERRNERMVSSPLRNGHVSLRSKYKLESRSLLIILHT